MFCFQSFHFKLGWWWKKLELKILEVAMDLHNFSSDFHSVQKSDFHSVQKSDFHSVQKLFIGVTPPNREAECLVRKGAGL